MAYDPKRDYYQLLQVDPRAHPRLIDVAYKLVQNLVHPDHGGSTERSREVNEAGSVLRDASKRAQYDQARTDYLSRHPTPDPGQNRSTPGDSFVDSTDPHGGRQLTAALMKLELVYRGEFLRCVTGELFYFDKVQNRLLALSSAEFVNRMAKITGALGLFPTEPDLNSVAKHLQVTCANQGRLVEIHRLAHFDTKRRMLYVSRFDGSVYRLDGETITLVNNGTDGVLFLDSPLSQPYTYLGARRLSAYKGLFHKTLVKPLSFEGAVGDQVTRQKYRRLFWAWLLSCFFTSLIPTRPVLILVGRGGSGKSTALRRFLQLLFGPTADVDGVTREKLGDFQALLLKNRVVAIDNLGTLPDWLMDDLACVCAGPRIKTRKPYATAEEVAVRPDACLAIAARRATLRRDDILDGALVLPLRRRKNSRSEREILEAVKGRRNRLWSDLLRGLNRVVRALRDGISAPGKPGRMDDWFDFVWNVARAFGFERHFEDLMTAQVEQHAGLRLEGDPLLPALLAWTRNPKNVDRPVTSKDLLKRLAAVAAEKGLKWTYKSPRSLAQRIRKIESIIRKYVTMTVAMGRGGYATYAFKSVSAAGGN